MVCFDFRVSGGFMPRFQRAAAIALCALIVSASTQGASEGVSYKVKYSGGSVPGIKTGDNMTLYLDKITVGFIHGDDTPFQIKTASVTEVSYGQDVHRRVGTAIGLAVFSLGIGALMALSKSKKHFIGLVWDDGAGNKGGLVFQADKNEYRGILSALEGLTGKTAVNTDLGRPSS